MTFGQAMDALLGGSHVYRKGWHKVGMHLYVEDWAEGRVDFSGKNYQPCIVLFVGGRTHQPGWLPSQADIFAQDWQIRE